VFSDRLTRAIGEQLRRHRMEHDLNARAVKERGGPSTPTVLKIERGLFGQWKEVVAYANALNVPFEEILRQAQAMPSAPISADTAALVETIERLKGEGRTLIVLAVEAHTPRVA
jgi:hypothetical protein